MPRHRALGVLAGGLALGVASAMTVAAWQDPETATASFAAGTFETLSQGAGGEWQHHGPGSPAMLGAEVSGLAPGGTAEAPTAGGSRYGALSVRTAPGSSRGGTVQLTEVSGDGALGAVLEARVVVREASSSACTPEDFGPGSTYLLGGPSSYAALGTAAAGDGVEIGPDGENPVGLCLDLRVAAPSPGDDGAQVQGSTAQIGLSVTVHQL